MPTHEPDHRTGRSELMQATADGNSASYALAPEIIELRDLARRIVRKELLPLEQQYLASPNHAYGLPPITNLKSVFPKQVVDRLVGLSRETGLWHLMVPEEYGGSGLGIMAQVIALEEFYYSAIPFPFASVANIL